MSCPSNSVSPIILDISYTNDANCFDYNNECGGNIKNAKCVIYTGPNLPCSGVNTNDSLETALLKIDEQICSGISDYSSFEMNCLRDYWETSITTDAIFVDAITSYACLTNTNLTTFIGTTFPSYRTIVTNRFLEIENPTITCASVGITDVDSIANIYTKYCTKFTALDTFLDISEVVWNSCYTVIGSPTTLADAFEILTSQICDTKDLITSYTNPLFNNVGSCIDGASNNTLEETIELIKTRLCLTPLYNSEDVTWGCVLDPGGATNNLQGAFNNVVADITVLKQNYPTFSNDFTVTQTDEDNVCAGITVSLATPPTLDRFVAATAGDASPGTLQSKLVAGTNVTLDFTTPTEVTINATSNDTYKVKADTSESDGEAGFLTDKINGATDATYGLTITPSYDALNLKTKLTPSVDIDTFWTGLYTFINSSLQAQIKFCELASMCATSPFGTVNWTFINSHEATTLNYLQVKNAVTNTQLLLENLLSVVTTTGTLSTSLTTNGIILQITVVPGTGNTFTELSITDTTLGVDLYPNYVSEYGVDADNIFNLTVQAGHTYEINAVTSIG